MLTRWKVTRAAIDAATKLLALQLRGDGDEGDDATAASEEDGVFYAMLGVAVRPLTSVGGAAIRTLRALGYEDGDEVSILKLWDRARTPVDLAAGETRLFACGDITVRVCLTTGGLTIEAKGATVEITTAGRVNVTSAGGQDIVLNGGSLRVARETDAVSANASMATWIASVSTATGATPPIGFGAIAAGGAARVRA